MGIFFDSEVIAFYPCTDGRGATGRIERGIATLAPNFLEARRQVMPSDRRE